MAEPEVRIGVSTLDDAEDAVMQGGDEENGDVIEVSETVTAEQALNSIDDSLLEDEKPIAQSIIFLDYLQSPIITLLLGDSSDRTFTAHEKVLTRSPYLSTLISSSTQTRNGTRTVSLPDEDLVALASTIEYLYTDEYYPRRPSRSAISSIPMDTDGSQLLHHARIYTLATKLELPALSSLALSKIHLISSTAQAELAYARYVYSHTSRTDDTIRKPVASFWGQRSHVLRHETQEGGFRAMCLEFPEFAFDVLSFVLDVEEKREKRLGSSDAGDASTVGKGSARKRARTEKAA